MANTFFGFNTTLNDHAERLGSSPEDIEGLEAEEEYDALNEETFGALENDGNVDDWEAQHEQLAEIAESSRHSNDIDDFTESVLDHLGLNDDDSIVSKDASVWSYLNDLKNGDEPDSSILDSSIKRLLNITNKDVNSPSSPAQLLFPCSSPCQGGPVQPPALPKLRTVEELERMLLNQGKPAVQPQIQHGQQHQQQQGMQQQPGQHPFKEQAQHPGGPRYPPGFQPLMWNTLFGPGPGPGPMHPGVIRVLGPRGRGPPPPPPGFMGYHSPGHQQPPYPLVPPHVNYALPPRVAPYQGEILTSQRSPLPKHPYNASNQNHAHHRHNPPPHYGQQPGPPHHHHQVLGPRSAIDGDFRDEYAGLMNNREKQWLLNIQLLQVNTGTPYFDDYYYTVFKERQAENKDYQGDIRNSQQRFHGNRGIGGNRDGNAGHHHRCGNNSQNHHSIQEQQNPVKKTYTPLQFENSLGKLQFGSVTAPRKIIDMDIISTNEPETIVTRDSRKTKQLLLELEALYTLLLKAEDLRNPLAISNQEKLIELRQKQRLREMDLAPTPEQKQEVLRLLQAESLIEQEQPQDLLNKLLNSLLVDDKLASFLAIRKGKMLVLRLLPQLALHGDVFDSQLFELWCRVLLAIPVVGRRDSVGDNILIRLHPLFKKFINVTDTEQILELISSLIEIIKLENSRSTPLSHQSKPPLHFVLQNKFGVSAVATILQRIDSLLSTFTNSQLVDWTIFINSLLETLSLVNATSSKPIEPITDACLNHHIERLGEITNDKKKILQNVFLDSVH